MSEYDYVIVGAGSAGCILATRLAQSGAEVLLVEAGASDRTRFCDIPGMVSVIHTVPEVKKRFDWGFYTVPQKHALDRRIPAVRGKVLGGSSSINGMLFVRGNRSNYDDWARDGCPGWSFDDVLPAFKRMEDWEGGAGDYRGQGGPIAVTKKNNLTPASTAFIEAVMETFSVPLTDDYNAGEQEGAMVFQQSARGGRRFSSSLALRKPEPRLGVRTGVLVERLVMQGSHVRGVSLRVGREREIVHARREVVLCAGVFGSPQLLMLSGIGPAEHLRGLGIDVVADLPVGDNLHDHMFMPLTFLAPSAKHRGTLGHFLGGMLTEAVRGNSWFGGTVFEGGAFVRSKHAENGVPDLQIHMLPWAYPSPNQDKPVRPVVDMRPAMTLMPTLIYPKSRGTVRLASADPEASPLIDPAYLSDPRDRQFLFDGVKLMRDVAASARLREVVTGELHPADAARDDDALRRELPNRATTVYHPVGTCRMGSDERAVVDPLLRVRGIEGLRVADAAIMPSITGGNTNAPAMMIGQRCAELMLANQSVA
ncbi:MAG TPA: GMC family oxidoreductase N-terminal domain-containing protein [Polyangiales bacterium]|nr:GMC family oxidoreductase N-terminal domain-containing protein [Polyangiales bacterium]